MHCTFFSSFLDCMTRLSNSFIMNIKWNVIFSFFSKDCLNRKKEESLHKRNMKLNVQPCYREQSFFYLSWGLELFVYKKYTRYLKFIIFLFYTHLSLTKLEALSFSSFSSTIYCKMEWNKFNGMSLNLSWEL